MRSVMSSWLSRCPSSAFPIGEGGPSSAERVQASWSGGGRALAKIDQMI
ncbi:hypothetical protein [Methanothrix sp.]